MRKFKQQVNIKLTDEDVKSLDRINEIRFGGEGNYAMICRMLLKQALKEQE